jgi:hypothetical protein
VEAVLNGELLPVRADLEQGHPGDTNKTAEHSAQ